MLPRITCVVLLLSHLSVPVESAEVTQFRGSNGDGIATETRAPVSFSEKQNIAWKTEIPGKGWSSPVIADGKLWLTTAEEVFPTEAERKEMLAKAGNDPQKFSQLAIAKSITLKILQVNLRTGELEKSMDLVDVDEPDQIHKTNSYASPTPVIDGKNIICHFGTYGTFCLKQSDLSILWEKRIPLSHSVGPGSSPFVCNDLLILICDGLEQQYVTALNKTTGKAAWKTARPKMDAANGEQKKSFDTPIAVVDRLGREQLICMGSQWLVAYEPETGKEIWKVDHGTGFSVVPRPVVGNGMVYISTGFGRAKLMAIRLDGTGDVTETHVAWEEKRNIPTKPSPLLVGERIYVIGDTGIATCFDAIDGTTIWTQRVGGNYSSSPLFADGKIYFANHDGIVTVIAPEDEYRELAENQLDGQIMATPIAIDDSLFIRTDTSLYRIEADDSASSDGRKVSDRR